MATSLLELATQIQSMELSFTTILMEAAMKLASLTDANIFMIVDTQEGRRYIIYVSSLMILYWQVC